MTNTLSELGSCAQPAFHFVCRSGRCLIPLGRVPGKRERYSRRSGAHTTPAFRVVGDQGIKPVLCHVYTLPIPILSNFAYTKFYSMPKHIFHASNEFGVFFHWNAPIIIFVRSDFVFLKSCETPLSRLAFPERSLLPVLKVGVSNVHVLPEPDRMPIQSAVLLHVRLLFDGHCPN